VDFFETRENVKSHLLPNINKQMKDL